MFIRQIIIKNYIICVHNKLTFTELLGMKHTIHIQINVFFVLKGNNLFIVKNNVGYCRRKVQDVKLLVISPLGSGVRSSLSWAITQH